MNGATLESLRRFIGSASCFCGWSENREAGNAEAAERLARESLLRHNLDAGHDYEASRVVVHAGEPMR